MLFMINQLSFALPTDIEVISGSADIEYSNNNLTITADNNTILNYSGFDIAEGESVIINLPNADSQILNNVLGSNASQIMGNLNCNGLFILVNQSGIYVGATARINVQSAIMSTRGITNENFLNRNYVFRKLTEAEEKALIEIKGEITINDGGFGAFIAGAIRNEGKIMTRVGTIALASGDAVTMNISGDGHINVAILEEVANKILDVNGNPITDAISNTGEISAAGGMVIMDSDSAIDVFHNAINLTGYVTADSFEEKDGVINLTAGGGDILLDGNLETDTGKITVRAGENSVFNSGTINAEVFDEKGYTFVNTGTLLGGEYFYDNLDGAVKLLNGTISANQTDTDNIIVDGDVTLGADNLIFTADSDNDQTGVFYMNDGTTIDGVNGTNYNLTIISGESAAAGNGLAGGEAPKLESFDNMGTLTLDKSTGSTPAYTSDPTDTTWVINNFRMTADVTLNRFTGAGTVGDEYMVYDVYGLQAMNGFLTSDFKLDDDIDASGTSNWNSGGGFDPIGNDSAGDDSDNFTGTFDGDNNTISGLTIDRADEDYVGLFGYAGAGSTIENFDMTGGSIVGSGSVGNVVGLISCGTLDNVSATGDVTGDSGAGGVAGYVNDSAVSNSYYASGTVTNSGGCVFCSGYLGGLIGCTNSGTTIDDSYSTGTVDGTGAYNPIGGLVGKANSTVISNSYATGDVSTDNASSVGRINRLLNQY